MHSSYGFYFDKLPARGAIFRLNAGWEAWQHRLDLSNVPEVGTLLGQILAALPLLANQLKHARRVQLQWRGDGIAPLMVAQYWQLDDQNAQMRGLLNLDFNNLQNNIQNINQNNIKNIKNYLGNNAQLILAVEPARGARWEGVVDIQGKNIADILAHYFLQSEQLPTQFWLAADGDAIAGMMLQRLPDPGRESEADIVWEHLLALSNTVKDEELLGLPPTDVLHRLFHQEPLRVMPTREVKLDCTCSHARVLNMVLNLGEADVRALLAERGDIETRCEFCQTNFVIGEFEALSLFQATGNVVN